MADSQQPHDYANQQRQAVADADRQAAAEHKAKVDEEESI